MDLTKMSEADDKVHGGSSDNNCEIGEASTAASRRLSGQTGDQPPTASAGCEQRWGRTQTAAGRRGELELELVEGGKAGIAMGLFASLGGEDASDSKRVYEEGAV
jgi:hypothetical protein